jgi:PPM family protein phosphatase
MIDPEMGAKLILKVDDMTFITESITSGHGRQSNQDYLGHLTSDQANCWVVADGLGGHKGGEVASRMAVEAILESFRTNPEATPDAIRQHLDAAQQAILDQQQADPTLAFMRTTVVVLVADKGKAIWGHVGDSRLYAFREGRLVFQTKDHSVSQSLASSGEIHPEDIRFHEDRNRLLRTLGQEGELRPTIPEKALSLEAGDGFLLCTDGFWEQVTETEMEVDLVKVNTPEEWLEKMRSRLLRRTLAEDALMSDNYTALAVFVDD